MRGHIIRLNSHTVDMGVGTRGDRSTNGGCQIQRCACHFPMVGTSAEKIKSDEINFKSIRMFTNSSRPILEGLQDDFLFN